MKVLFDDQIFTSQRFGGVSRYFCNIIGQCKEKKLLDVKLSLVYSENDYLEKLRFIKCLRFLKDKEFKGVYRVFKFFKNLNRWNSIRHIKQNTFDLFHPTYHDPYFLPYLQKPFVATVHDMIHSIFVDTYFKSDDITVTRKKKMAKKATRIISVSQNTKDDLVKFYGIDPDKIDVVYHANSLDVKKGKKLVVPERYLFFVGDRTRYKNFMFFIRAVMPILKKQINLHVACAGGGSFTQEEELFFTSNGIADRIFRYIPDDEELVFLYQNALAFVFPSLYEGFGIPILEAFACGCPVVLSNTSCFPEIAQDAALYFDPRDTGSICDSVERVCNDATLRKTFVVKGSSREKDFSWKKAAAQTKRVYKKAVQL